MSKPTTPPTAPEVKAPCPSDVLFDKAKALVERMVNIEQEPDLISVFSIARAHGYKLTSRFWHEELKATADALMQYDNAKKAAAKAK